MKMQHMQKVADLLAVQLHVPKQIKQAGQTTTLCPLRKQLL